MLKKFDKWGPNYVISFDLKMKKTLQRLLQPLLTMFNGVQEDGKEDYFHTWQKWFPRVTISNIKGKGKMNVEGNFPGGPYKGWDIQDISMEEVHRFRIENSFAKDKSTSLFTIRMDGNLVGSYEYPGKIVVSSTVTAYMTDFSSDVNCGSDVEVTNLIITTSD